MVILKFVLVKTSSSEFISVTEVLAEMDFVWFLISEHQMQFGFIIRFDNSKCIGQFMG